MPRNVIDVQQTFDNITRPVALQIAERLGRVMNLPPNTKLLLPDAAEAALFPNSELGAKDPANPATFGHTDQLQIEIQENPVEGFILSTAVHQVDQRAIFLDPELKIRIWPVKMPKELAFNFVARFQNRTRARQFRDEILNRTSALREGIMHELDYYYHVPKIMQELLVHLHTLREKTAGYGEDYPTWLTKHITPTATELTDQIGWIGALAVAEKQVYDLGHFDFTGTTDPEEVDKRSGTWTVSFGYKLVYDQVTQLVMEYPLQVHQSLVDSLWYGRRYASGELVDPDRRKRTQTHSREAMDFFTNSFINRCLETYHSGLTLPEFDEWKPKFAVPNTSTLYTAMLGLDPTAPRSLYNLFDDDLYGYSLSPSLREFMEGEAPYVCRKGASIFDLRLYLNDDPMDDGCLLLDADGNVTLNVVPDFRQRYHVRLALVNNLFTLNSEAQMRLRSAGQVGIDILNTLQWKLLGKAFTPRLLGGRVISREDFETIAQRINDLKVPHRGPFEFNILTVNEAVIIAHRSNNVGNHQTQPNGSGSAGSGAGSDPFTDPAPCCS
jgi:hypothetical protein